MLKEIDGRILNFDFSKLIDFQYIFSKTASSDFEFKSWFLLIGLVSIILGFLVIFIAGKKFNEIRPKYNFIKRFATYHIIISIYFIIMVLLRASGFNFYPRLFISFALDAEILLLIYGIVYWIKFLPGKIKTFYNAKNRSKYLPKKKG